VTLLISTAHNQINGTRGEGSRLHVGLWLWIAVLGGRFCRAIGNAGFVKVPEWSDMVELVPGSLTKLGELVGVDYTVNFASGSLVVVENRHFYSWVKNRTGSERCIGVVRPALIFGCITRLSRFI